MLESVVVKLREAEQTAFRETEKLIDVLNQMRSALAVLPPEWDEGENQIEALNRIIQMLYEMMEGASRCSGELYDMAKGKNAVDHYPSGGIYVLPNVVQSAAYGCMEESKAITECAGNALARIFDIGFGGMRLENQQLECAMEDYRRASEQLAQVFGEAYERLEEMNIALQTCDDAVMLMLRQEWTPAPDRPEPTPPRTDSVQFSAVAPEKATPGRYFPVNIVMYEDGYRGVVDRLLQQEDGRTKESEGGYADVEKNARVRVELTSKDVEVEDGEDERVWHGKYINFDFAVMIPEDFAKQQILFRAKVYINGIVAARLKLIVECGQEQPAVTVSREDILSAFISYASQDRNRVAAIVQGMRKARPDMDIFFDVESLRSGQLWETALRDEILKRDMLFLCWSKYARESKWVEMEWKYALECRGEDCIEPIPIDPPDECPPPAELRDKHFNDRMLYILKATRKEQE